MVAAAVILLALAARPLGPMGRFIVHFPGRVTAASSARAELEVRSAPNGSVGLIRHRFADAFQGLVAELSDEAVKHFLAGGAKVMVDMPVYAIGRFQAADTVIMADTPVNTAAVESWGLDRIDQASLPLDNMYDTNNFGSSDTHIYVVDTGLNEAHSQFTGRVGQGYDAVDNDNDPDDCNGHGTHCAGSAAGSTVGVAKNAIIHGVRVLNCEGSGSFSDVLLGLEWVAARPEQRKVASLSLGGGKSADFDALIEAYVDAGLPVVVAAGNDGEDACNYSPAAAAKAITVGATQENDEAASYSNAGSCVDIFAPGSIILSSWIGGTNTGKIESGTSMATPHVAGVVAQIMASTASVLTPAEIWTVMQGAAVTGKLKDSTDNRSRADRNVPNVLLQVVRTTIPSPPPSPPSPPPPPSHPPSPPSPPSPPPAPTTTLRIEITNDYYSADETRWQLMRFLENTWTTVESGSPTATAVSMWTYSISAGKYLWQISDAYGDGICCDYGNGGYRLYLAGNLIASGGAFGVSAAHSFEWGLFSPPPPAPPPLPPSSPPPSNTTAAADDNDDSTWVDRLVSGNLSVIEWVIVVAVPFTLVAFAVASCFWCYARGLRSSARLAVSGAPTAISPQQRSFFSRAQSGNVADSSSFANVGAGGSLETASKTSTIRTSSLAVGAPSQEQPPAVQTPGSAPTDFSEFSLSRSLSSFRWFGSSTVVSETARG